MACLVTGVYELENDREHRGRQLFPSEVDTNTAKWWTHFRYELEEMLVDHSENGNPTIFGAVYRFNQHDAPTGAATIVIAFRGTMKRKTDWKVNLTTYLGRLESHPRFTAGLNAVERAVVEVGWERVCVTGHSKGAAIGLLVGRAMAEKGKPIEAHLFNPPNITLQNGRPLGLIPAPSPWQPILYVHVQDPICSAYITHFEAARYVPPVFCKIMTMPHSIRQSVLSMVGLDSKPHHLIPCARLVIGKHSIKEAHNLRQWYDTHPSETAEVEACRMETML